MSGTVTHIGVFTSGGDAPGMNAAVRAVVRTAHYRGVKVSGVMGGFDGMINGDLRSLGVRDVSNIIQRGGTILRSARSKAFMTVEGRAEAMTHLRSAGIDALVAIGGNGTFTGLGVLEQEHGIVSIGLPGTIDNDLAGTDHTIGFDTAVNTAVEAIDRIRDTASSHDRHFFVEVMGRDSGFIALVSAVASGAEYVMVPEREQTIDDLVKALQEGSTSKSSSIVVVAEGDEAGGAFTIAKQVKERLPERDIRVTVLGHLLRGGAPSASDRILASRLGVASVEALLAGESGKMAGVVNGNVVLTPYATAIHGRKELSGELLRDLSILAI
jgi:6-phosphofructokinase 1